MPLRCWRRGHIDLCLEPALQPFDIVALIPIIEQAGGVVTRLDGGRPESGGAILASATPELHVQALNAIAAGEIGNV
jgi:fructose-1,6-bisphosphatase/inositol monophosphatase family enzyme